MISFSKLKKGFIVGVIDSYGAVHSKFVDIKEIYSHEVLFPMQTFKRWRWSFSDCFDSSILSNPFDIEDWDKIERHLTKKYGIRFFLK